MSSGKVSPFSCSTWNPIWPWQYIFGKMWTITCGRCRHTWREKLPINLHISAVCPCCLVQNFWWVDRIKIKDRRKNS